MSSGSLIDLDPPPTRERRWPFYVGWAVGGAVVGAVMMSHLPASLTHPTVVQIVAPVVSGPPEPTGAPTPPRFVVPPQGTPGRIAPAPVTPARP